MKAIWKERKTTHLGRTLKLVVGSERDVEDVLVRVDKRVHDGGNGGDTSGQRDGGNGLDTRNELVNKGLLLNIEDGRGEDGTVVVDLDDSHTVGEGRDVEHVQQCSLRGADLATGGNDLNVRDDFNGTTGNLGGDTKGLEERGLSGLHTSVTGRNVDVVGGKGTGTGGGGDLVRDDDLSDVLEVTRGEDETNVSLDERHELLELGELGEDGSDSTSDHGVLAHKNNTLATESLSDHVTLLGRDVVNVDDEDGG